MGGGLEDTGILTALRLLLHADLGLQCWPSGGGTAARRLPGPLLWGLVALWQRQRDLTKTHARPLRLQTALAVTVLPRLSGLWPSALGQVPRAPSLSSEGQGGGGEGARIAVSLWVGAGYSLMNLGPGVNDPGGPSLCPPLLR